MGYSSVKVGNSILKIEGYRGVSVGNYCLGFQLMYYYSMLILVSDMLPKKKLIGLPSGIILTTFLNIIRISALNLMTVYTPNWMFVGHDYIFNFGVFAILMLVYYKLMQ